MSNNYFCWITWFYQSKTKHSLNTDYCHVLSLIESNLGQITAWTQQHQSRASTLNVGNSELVYKKLKNVTDVSRQNLNLFIFLLLQCMGKKKRKPEDMKKLWKDVACRIVTALHPWIARIYCPFYFTIL